MRTSAVSRQALRVTVPASTNAPYHGTVRCPHPRAHVLTARWLELLSLSRDRSRKHNPVQYATEDARKRRVSVSRVTVPVSTNAPYTTAVRCPRPRPHAHVLTVHWLEPLSRVTAAGNTIQSSTKPRTQPASTNAPHQLYVVHTHTNTPRPHAGSNRARVNAAGYTTQSNGGQGAGRRGGGTAATAAAAGLPQGQLSNPPP